MEDLQVKVSTHAALRLLPRPRHDICDAIVTSMIAVCAAPGAHYLAGIMLSGWNRAEAGAAHCR